MVNECRKLVQEPAIYGSLPPKTAAVATASPSNYDSSDDDSSQLITLLADDIETLVQVLSCSFATLSITSSKFTFS